MNRFEQRKQKFLQDPEVMEGYQEMAAEFQLMQAIETIRAGKHISKESLATQMGRKREAVSRLLTASDPNPTLSTIIELLSALQLTADIVLRRSQEGEGPLKVAIEFDLATT
jgi:transcriptional regulator with XRE-family HTH domain